MHLLKLLSSATRQSIEAAEQAAGTALALTRRFPKHSLAALGVSLLGVGATAFAVATLSPETNALAVSEITEPLAIDLPTGTKALLPLPLTLYRSEVIRANDTADSLLRRLGVQDAGAANFIRNDLLARANVLGRAGRMVMVETNAQHALQKLTVRWITDDTSNQFQRFVMERNTLGSITSRLETGSLTASTRLSSGVIRVSLFAATDEARIPDNVAVQLAEIFSTDIDFIRDVRKGDRFNVVYESLEADGEPMRAGRVLSAEFVNGGKKYEAVWFQEPQQKGQYYTLDGKSLRKAFLASPLEFSRVTSGFGGRLHPLAKQWRMHNGVDYAAPTGTSVRSVGDGVVHFAGPQGGYGNVIEVMHRDGKSTVYAHLSKINVRLGQRVEQGDAIGAVGTTGWSTGPHLHFEFRINGTHRDPMTIAKESGNLPLSAAARPAFDRVSAQMRSELSAASSLTHSRVQ